MDEIVKSKPSQFPKLIQEYSRSGWLHVYNRKKIEHIEREVGKKGACKSNDIHNVALAILSGSHVLLSDDNLFIEDFRNARIVPTRRNCRKKILRDDGCVARARALACCNCLKSS